MDIAFPIEFIVDGTPVSAGAKRPETRSAWKERVKAASRTTLPEGHWASADRIAVTLFYFPAKRGQGDIDNIVKLVLDALCKHVYMDDAQVERVLVQKFEPGNVFPFRSPSSALEAALSRTKPVLCAFVQRSVRGLDMRHEASEATLLESVLPDLEAEGFEVFAKPSPPLLPPFMRDHSPDAIALRKDKKLAIEVLHEGAPSNRRLDMLRELFSGHKDWELRVYWISPSSTSREIAGASRNVIEQSIKAVEELTADRRTGPALLMAWATFEAIGRAILPEKLQRPQPPGRLTEVLAAEGYITPNEADHLRRLAESRNDLIHGGLETSVSEADLLGFLDVLKPLCHFIL